MELLETGGRARTVKCCSGSGPALPWDRFSAWLECVCVVTFDLELGQAIELVYPHDMRLTEKEKTSICYLSFPDSYSGFQHQHILNGCGASIIVLEQKFKDIYKDTNLEQELPWRHAV